VAELLTICPACDRDVEVYTDRRYRMRLESHRTPLGLRCKASRSVVDIDGVQVIPRIGGKR
jgi:hypothetical protein